MKATDHPVPWVSDVWDDLLRTLIRFDILVVLRRVYDVSKDEAVWSAARRLMTLEENATYAKKYTTVWR